MPPTASTWSAATSWSRVRTGTGAIKEFEKAAGVKDTAEARDSLKNAQKQLVIAQDKAAADKALTASKDFQAQHNMIKAYEVLASLTARPAGVWLPTR